MLTDCLPHGDGLLADRFIRNLAARGHTLHVVTAGMQIQHPYPANVTLHPLSTGSNGVGLGARIRFAVAARAKLKELATILKFDLIHQLNPVVTGLSLGMYGVPFPFVMGPYVPDWPLIVREGRLQRPGTIYRLKRSLKRLLWNRQHRMASGIILSTPAALEKVSHIERNRDKIRVIPYGIDAEVFNHGPFPSAPTILFLGHVMHHKGILVLLEAYRHVLERLPGAKLVVAGTGSQMEEARALAASIAASDQISFLGRVRREDIASVMQNCTLYCMPSYGEAFGLGALEAMACGRPVVGTDAGGLAYLISNEGGRKVTMGDAPALAVAMLEILSNPPLAQHMGAANRRLVEQRYAWPRVIDQLEEMYFTILESALRSATKPLPQ